MPSSLTALGMAETLWRQVNLIWVWLFLNAKKTTSLDHFTRRRVGGVRMRPLTGTTFPSA